MFLTFCTICNFRGRTSALGRGEECSCGNFVSLVVVNVVLFLILFQQIHSCTLFVIEFQLCPI